MAQPTAGLPAPVLAGVVCCAQLAPADAFGLQTADLDFEGKAKVVYRLPVVGRASDMAGQEPGHGCEVVA
jgi:hypothetical protein